MNDDFCRATGMTKLNYKRGRLLEKVEDMVWEARDRYINANFSGVTAKLRQIQNLLNRELPKREKK